ncbi:hypothetical protein E2320_015354 [Naja naja]|nr:hypothetical protein E2320_015354 [Naja naja]
MLISAPQFLLRCTARPCHLQERKASLPASPTWTPQLIRRPSSSLEGWMSPAQTPESEDGLVEAFRAAHVMTPPPPMSPSWSERSLSPFRQEIDQKSSRQMQVLLARNIINAARRKSSSPKLTGVENFRPFTPPVTCPNVSSTGGSPKNRSTHSPSPLQSPKLTGMDGYRRASLPVSAAPPQASASSNNSPSKHQWDFIHQSKKPGCFFSHPPKSHDDNMVPRKRFTSMSPTNSEASVDSDCSGVKSPSIRSFNICPRGWNGSLRLKRGSLPSEASCTS